MTIIHAETGDKRPSFYKRNIEMHFIEKKIDIDWNFTEFISTMMVKFISAYLRHETFIGTSK